MRMILLSLKGTLHFNINLDSKLVLTLLNNELELKILKKSGGKNVLGSKNCQLIDNLGALKYFFSKLFSHRILVLSRI